MADLARALRTKWGFGAGAAGITIATVLFIAPQQARACMSEFDLGGDETLVFPFLVTCDATLGGQVAQSMTFTLDGLLSKILDDALLEGIAGPPGDGEDGAVSPAGPPAAGPPAAGPGAAMPMFGVFAAGQFARVSHDGFDFSGPFAAGPFGSGSTPTFTSKDFSAAASLDFNAARHFGFDQQYGLNLGIFGGYASTDLTLGPSAGFDPSGWARNEAGMAGGYALFRKERNYLLVSGMALFGETDVRAADDTTGSYDTFGYAVTASAGRIFLLSDRLRFDLRGGILGASFRGDSYVDSFGFSHGPTRVSFGAIKFEPGIYGDYALENGMVFSPYLRGELQQRFGYRNEAGFPGFVFRFEDSDFSAALSAGFNLRMTPASTVSGEVRGKVSPDSTTIAAKLGLKVAF